MDVVAPERSVSQSVAFHIINCPHVLVFRSVPTFFSSVDSSWFDIYGQGVGFFPLFWSDSSLIASARGHCENVSFAFFTFKFPVYEPCNFLLCQPGLSPAFALQAQSPPKHVLLSSVFHITDSSFRG